jgi:hypothetical protein
LMSGKRCDKAVCLGEKQEVCDGLVSSGLSAAESKLVRAYQSTSFDTSGFCSKFVRRIRQIALFSRLPFGTRQTHL